MTKYLKYLEWIYWIAFLLLMASLLLGLAGVSWAWIVVLTTLLISAVSRTIIERSA